MDAQVLSINAVRMAQKARLWRKTYLREWREFRGITLESASAQMGLHHGQLSKIERGLHPYNQHVLETAALEYRCSIADLLTRKPTDADREPAPQRRQA